MRYVQDLGSSQMSRKLFQILTMGFLKIMKVYAHFRWLEKQNQQTTQAVWVPLILRELWSSHAFCAWKGGLYSDIIQLSGTRSAVNPLTDGQLPPVISCTVSLLSRVLNLAKRALSPCMETERHVRVVYYWGGFAVDTWAEDSTLPS